MCVAPRQNCTLLTVAASCVLDANQRAHCTVNPDIEYVLDDVELVGSVRTEVMQLGVVALQFLDALGLCLALLDGPAVQCSRTVQLLAQVIVALEQVLDLVLQFTLGLAEHTH